MSTQFKKGDKARIVIEGEVSYHNFQEDRLCVNISPGPLGGNSYAASAQHGVRFELVERARPKVGDMVHGAELDALPEGSVIRQVLGGLVYNSIWFRGHHGWFGMVDKHVITDRPFSHYRVEFIPEPTP